MAIPESRSMIAETEVDVLPWVSRCALEYVCQGGLGHSFGALNPHSENEYIHAVRMLGYGRYLCAAFLLRCIQIHNSPSALPASVCPLLCA